MLTLHLVRHGQTNYNAERRVQGQFDSVLTETGIQQAEEMRATIAALRLTAVYSSSNVRARHTAEILVSDIPLEVECRDGLREIDMLPWQHRYWDEVAENDPEQYRFFMSEPDRFKIHGCETFPALQSRGVSAIEEIIKTETRGEVLVVSHGAILKTILAHYSSVPIRDMWSDPNLTNCSHSILHVGPKGERLVTQISNQCVRGTIWRPE